MEKITQSEFDSITSLQQLIEWSVLLGYDGFSDVIDEDNIDYLIDEWVEENASYLRWYELLGKLEDIHLRESETGYCFQESPLDYRPISQEEFFEMRLGFYNYLLDKGLLIGNKKNEDVDEDEEFETDIALEDMLKGA